MWIIRAKKARMIIHICIAVMFWLMPGRDHTRLATATVEEVMKSPALYAHDADRTQTLAMVLAIQFNESGFTPDVPGDCHGMKPGSKECTRELAHSFCAMQLNGERYRYTLDDVHACVREGLDILHKSYAACAKEPVSERLAMYARGSCESEEGKRISRNRYSLAKRIAAKIVEMLARV